MVINLEDEVKKLRYKPGWSFHYTPPTYESCFSILRITATVLHSITLEPVEFTIQRLIPFDLMSNVQNFLTWVKSVLAEAEIHEMREFFRYDDELVDNPHESVPVQ